MEQNTKPRNKPIRILSCTFAMIVRILTWKNNFFNKWCQLNQIFLYKKKKAPYHTPYTKVNSKWINDLNVRPETLKFLQENISENVLDIGLRNNVYILTPKVKATKLNIGKWD